MAVRSMTAAAGCPAAPLGLGRDLPPARLVRLHRAAFLIVLVFMYWPTFTGLYYAFTDWNPGLGRSTS